jgi:hypothetical protein
LLDGLWLFDTALMAPPSLVASLQPRSFERYLGVERRGGRGFGSSPQKIDGKAAGSDGGGINDARNKRERDEAGGGQ